MTGDIYSDSLISELRRLDAAAELPSFFIGWTVEDFIANGSYGSVYKIKKRSQVNSKSSALKVVEVTPEQRAAYVAEVALVQNIDSYYVAHIEDFDEIKRRDSQKSYLLMRMELLTPIDPASVTLEQVISLGIQICAGLQVCHASIPQIIHSDIKPDNILVTPAGNYKLGDFGSLQLGAGESGQAIGTPYFMPPEVVALKRYDHRADLYSLGLTLYVLLNKGAPPFIESGVAKALSRRLAGEALPALKGVPDNVMAVIRKATAKDPDARYQRASELRRALEVTSMVRRRFGGADMPDMRETDRFERYNKKFGNQPVHRRGRFSGGDV